MPWNATSPFLIDNISFATVVPTATYSRPTALLLLRTHQTQYAQGFTACIRRCRRQRVYSALGGQRWVLPRCPSEGATEGAAQAADQCHLEESSIILILFSIPSIPLVQICYSKQCKTRENFSPVFSTIIFHCFSSFFKWDQRKRLCTLLCTNIRLPYWVYRH